MESDNKDIMELRKALDTSSTNGNNVLDPVLLSTVISEQARRKPMARNVIPRIPWKTNVYTWDTEDTPGDAQIVADGSQITLSDGTYEQGQAKMSYFYQAGYVTNPAIEAAQELTDLVAMRVAGSTKSVLRRENAAIFQGDSANAQFPGLLAALEDSATYGYAGDGATFSKSLMDSIETNLEGNGYGVDAWFVTKGAYQILKSASFNAVRFAGNAGGGSIGFDMATPVQFNGKPVYLDIYAGNYVNVSAETLGTVDGNSKKFTFANIPLAGGSDQAGTSISAPVIKVSGSVQSSSSYTITGNSVSFTSAPSATPTANYTYQAETAYAVSLNPADLVIAELQGLNVVTNLAKEVDYDRTPFRVQEYAVLAVRNPLAHAVATGLVLPATNADFLG